MTKACPDELRFGSMDGPSRRSSLVMVAELISLHPPPDTRDTVDVTTHDSETDANGGVPMEFIGEPVYDPGDFTFKINYIMDSPGDLMILVGARRSDPLGHEACRQVGSWPAPARRFRHRHQLCAGRTADQGRPQTATVKVKRSGVWVPGRGHLRWR
jgi:hypothetical protein